MNLPLPSPGANCYTHIVRALRRLPSLFGLALAAACTCGSDQDLTEYDPCVAVTCDQSPGACFATVGTCSRGVCTYPPADGAPCDDGSACTEDDSCLNGVCVGVPTVCGTPPAQECVDTTAERVWRTPGACVAGTCDYVDQEFTCRFQCDPAVGTCVPDACEGVICDNAPGECSSRFGECSDGLCIYRPRVDGLTCSDGDPCTVSDGCNSGLCTGVPVSCNAPPPRTCVDATTQRAFAAIGQCDANGDCVYQSADVECPEGCQDGDCLDDPCQGVVCDTAPSVCHQAPGSCDEGTCTFGFADGVSCDDGDPCTTVDTCQQGVCVGAGNTCPTVLALFDGFDSTLYASSDEGVSWVMVGPVPIPSPSISTVTLRADGAFLVSSTQGLVRQSIDQGATWTNLPDAPWATDGPTGGSCQFLSLDTAVGGDVYAASAHSQRDGILYRSTDGGMSWVQLGTWAQQSGTMTTLAVSPAGKIYVVHAGFTGAPVFRSDDGGATFALVGTYDPSGLGGVALVAVDGAGTVFAAGQPETTFFASVDSGATFTARGAWIDGRSIQALRADSSGDLFAISVKGPVLKSTDAGFTWVEVGDWGTAATRNIISGSGWIGLIAAQ